jgi:hypothetical protein
VRNVRFCWQDSRGVDMVQEREIFDATIQEGLGAARAELARKFESDSSQAGQLDVGLEGTIQRAAELEGAI